MDIRIMQYYLAVVREGNISAAAQSLHVSQPALSRQIRDLEEELNVTLFERGNRRITLTEEGMILRKRAEEMVHLMEQTEKELAAAKNNISGDIYIGAGESHAFHYPSRTFSELMKDYPDIRIHVTSGDTRDLMDQLENGLIDYALLFTEFDRSIYQSLTLPEEDRFGVIMKKDSPLAAKEELSLSDLTGLPVFISRASESMISGNEEMSGLRIAGTYNLIYNASLLVEDGAGYALGFDRLINMTGDSPLTFRPLKPSVSSTGNLVWKKYQVLSPAAQLFIERMRSSL